MTHLNWSKMPDSQGTLVILIHEGAPVTYVTDWSKTRPINERYISVILQITITSYP